MKVVTAGIIKREEDGAILLVRRAPGQSLAGYWEFPGGKVEPNESEEDCLRRELEEELNLSVHVGAFVAESHYIYDHGEFLLKAFEVKSPDQPISLSVHDSSVWVPADQLTTFRLAPADNPIAEALKEG